MGTEKEEKETENSPQLVGRRSSRAAKQTHFPRHFPCVAGGPTVTVVP